MATFRPSTWPLAAKPLRNASTIGADPSGEPTSRYPITGIAAGCARAVSGQAAAEPATNLMKSRRLIAHPEAQDTASYRLTFAPTRKIVVKCSQHMPAWIRSRQAYAPAAAVHSRAGRGCIWCYAKARGARLWPRGQARPPCPGFETGTLRL